MAASKRDRQKLQELQRRGCFNSNAERVEDELFITDEFFDPCDLLQVKYEMVRRIRVEGHQVSHAARSFGFSRPTVYQALAAFEHGGITALMPRKPGPRRAHKLSDEIIAQLRQALADHPELTTCDLVAMVEGRYGLSVHGRSIERALTRHKKKPL